MFLAGLLTVGLVAAGGVLVLDKVASASGSGTQPTTLATRSTPHRRRPLPQQPPVGTIGRYAVGTRSILFVDNAIPGVGPRPLPTLVRYPIVPTQDITSGRYSRGPFPLVVFAPGFLQCRSAYSDLLNTWASAGYVVAAVQFPKTNCHLVGRQIDEPDMVNEPEDLTVVISRLLAISASPGKVLSGMIDPAKVAVAGHSDGGDVTAALAANTCCRDGRVKAAIVLSGAEYGGFGTQGYFTSPTPPMLFVQGSADTVNPPSASMTLYQLDTTGVRYYLDLFGATHLPPYEGSGPPEPIVARVTVAFLNAYLDGQSTQIARMTAEGDVNGVSVLVSNGQQP